MKPWLSKTLKVVTTGGYSLIVDLDSTVKALKRAVTYWYDRYQKAEERADVSEQRRKQMEDVLNLLYGTSLAMVEHYSIECSYVKSGLDPCREEQCPKCMFDKVIGIHKVLFR